MKLDGLRAAFAFFTRLPVGRPTADLRDAAGWLPVVGLVVGCLAGAAATVAGSLFSPFVCGVLGCLAWAIVTGGLHLDGVADCGDALWVETDPRRRLDIMRDSRLGTFGGAALFFVLAVKAAALAVLTFGPTGLASPAAVLCLTLALARGAERRLGGMTGDVFGCLVESAECVALLAFSARWY